MGTGILTEEKRELQETDEVTLKANGREVTVTGDDFEQVSRQAAIVRAEEAVSELKEAFQLEFEFGAIYSDIALSDAKRHVKAITRAGVRLGVIEEGIKLALETMAIACPIIIAAINAIEESLD